ncbi:unnamed protein product [Mytilus coruscus]|uniref:Sushi, von Willebrand factor type A, EGF and pentraxin domain-containing protein 1 n=1 Tax=Mytilus coruscus TaxID=42192 RepID=A0A6J8CCU6_MYTCO|nr:unnamed protein product [Mytilus coruscus]
MISGRQSTGGKRRGGCIIPPSWQEFKCDVVPQEALIPEGTKCTILSDNADTSNYVCESGMLVAMQHTNKGTSEHTIPKRALFAILGAVATAIGLAGSAVGIVCAFTECQSSSSSGGTSGNLVYVWSNHQRPKGTGVRAMVDTRIGTPMKEKSKENETELLFTFIITVHLVCVTEANIFHDLEGKVREGKERGGCIIPPSWQEFKCDVVPQEALIPEGTKCTILSDNADTSNYVCESGMLVAMQHTNKGTSEHTIPKRALFAILGAVATAIGLAGSAVGIVCAFTESPNKPPTVECPTVPDQIADKLKETVQVTWTEPTATDPEGQTVDISRSGDPSGSEFEIGSHAILYTTTDNVGYKDTCEIRFRVKVIYCNGSPHVEYGVYKCDTKSHIYGTVCSISCNEGYQLPAHSDAEITCDKNSKSGIWTPFTTVACEKKKCSTPINPCNGKLTCSDPGYEYQSVCHPTCNKGYDTDTTKFIICDVNGWSGQIDDCQDVQRPEFQFCPQTIHKFADRGTSEVAVQWSTPTANDNSQNDETCGSESSVTVKHISGLTSGSTFSTGNHEIIYSATDSSNNAANCSFTVIVEDEYVFVTCKAGYKYGASCSFSCFMSYKLVGDLEVTCERNSSNENAAYWNWTNNTESYCEKLSCPVLPAPVGGALACSTALGNQICTMSCARPNVVPLGTSIEYICNDEQVWLQGIPPNCTDYVHPSNAIKDGELFFYYDGDCSNQSVQNSIKQNFVDVMEHLESSEGWDNICPAYCTVEGVNVTCGAQNGRRRKRSSSDLIVLSFTIISEWQENDVLQGNDNIMTNLSDFMKTKVDEGAFDNPNVTTGDMAVGWSEYYCPEGQAATYSDDDGLCKGCPQGKYLQNEECIDCDQGYYQDEEYHINCTECPDGQSTKQVGSTSLSDCQDTCQPGTFSNTGLVPCSSCPRGKFQPETGAIACLPCPDQMFTLSTGSASQSGCTSIDAIFTSDSGSVLLPIMENEMKNFTLSYIMKHGDSSVQGLQFKLGNFEISAGNLIEMTVGSEYFNYTMAVESFTQWTHIAFTWNQSKRKSEIFINGQKRTAHIFNTSTDAQIEFSTNRILEIKAKAAGWTFTGLVFDNGILSDTLIYQLAENCSSNLSNALLTMNDVFKADTIDTELSFSKCDVNNECKTSPCGNDNICLNEQNGYSCQCLSGYSGANCDVPPDFCKVNGCKNNANCVSNFANYSCVCDSKFTGTFCETQIVHGNWGSWLGWSECSQSCNGGTQYRARYCDDPAPELYGLECSGTNMSSQACNTDLCPVCLSHSTIYSYKNSFNCTSISDSTSCVVTCQDGYSFVRDYQPLDQYECGPQTGHIWNAIPPPCARSDSPRAVRATAAVTYNQVDCSNEESVSDTLNQNLNNLQCVENNTCTVSTSTSGCESRRKHSTATSVQIVIQIYSELSEHPLILEEFYSNNIVSSGLLEVVTAYTDLTMSLHQLNATVVLTIDDKGTIYSADLSSLIIKIDITCPEGTVEQELICDECPFGTYWINGVCVMCPKGTYQDESGQVNCKNCPDGLTTQYIASKNQSECTDDTVTDTPVTESSGNQSVVIVAAVVGSIGTLIVIVSIVYIVRKYRTYMYKERRKEKLKKLSEMKKKQEGTSWSSLNYQPDNFRN